MDYYEPSSELVLDEERDTIDGFCFLVAVLSFLGGGMFIYNLDPLSVGNRIELSETGVSRVEGFAGSSSHVRSR